MRAWLTWFRIRTVLQAEAVAEIEAADVFVADNFMRLTLHQHPPFMYDEGAVNEFEGFADVVIRNKHPDSAICKVSNQGADITDCNRVNSRERFVEKHERRPRSKGSRDFDPAAFSARERNSRRTPEMGDGKFLE